MENTLFFGNGINKLNPQNESWNDLLDKIKDYPKFKNGDLPNTMIYERIILEKDRDSLNIFDDEFKVKDKIARLMEEISTNDVYSDLYNLNAKNYLTTNYDSAFIKSVMKNNSNLDIQSCDSEDVYSIRRVKKISSMEKKEKHLWHIHGEIKKPATIMLGLDHYCGEIGKIDDYIKGKYKYTEKKTRISENSILDKLEKNEFTGSSWIELFFNSNVHIFGFSFNYAEIDLWWIINKRARMKKSRFRELINNDIIFYCIDIDEYMEGVLESMDVKVEKFSSVDKNNKYHDYYKKLIEHFNSKINGTKPKQKKED